MSSEAITRNDLEAVLNEVLPPHIDEYILSSEHSTGSFSVSANAAGYKDVTISPPQADYVPLAVTNVVCNASAAIPTGWLFQNATTVRIYVRNVTSSAVSQTVTFKVLWKLTV